MTQTHFSNWLEEPKNKLQSPNPTKAIKANITKIFKTQPSLNVPIQIKEMQRFEAKLGQTRSIESWIKQINNWTQTSTDSIATKFTKSTDIRMQHQIPIKPRTISQSKPWIHPHIGDIFSKIVRMLINYTKRVRQTQ